MCKIYENGSMMKYQEMCSTHREIFFGKSRLEAITNPSSDYKANKNKGEY